MAASDKLFGGSIPEIYDRILVPLFFEPFARDLAERLAGLVVGVAPGALWRIIRAQPPSSCPASRDLRSGRTDCS